MFSVGELVVVKAKSRYHNSARGYKTFPGEYGFHTVNWVPEGTGVVLVVRDTFYHVHVHDTSLWFEERQLRKA